MNFNDDAVIQLANNVALSVKVAVNPTSDGPSRLQAHQFYEDFRKNATPLERCTVGFVLTRRTEEHVIWAGLQLIEHVAKYQWNALSDRQHVKDLLLQLMHNGLTSCSAVWPPHLQEALSKVIVEIAKREWPQLWPDLFPKLFEMANVSDLALLVLRRMAEDVVTLQLVDCSERRRELSQSLNTIAPEVITTLFTVLVSSVQQYNTSKSEALKRRGKVCLGCLLPYLEWLNPLIFTKENRIPVLFALLPEKEFQIEAADCIIQVLERKCSKKEDKYEMPKMCLESDCCSPLMRSIDECTDDPDFLRKTGEILSLVGQYVTEGKVNVENFFNCAMKLVNKPQAIAVLGGAISVNQYLKAQSTSNDLTESPTGKALTCLLNAICNKFVSAPPKPEEKDELARLKAEFSQMLRGIGKCLPKLYKEVNAWLHSSLSSPNAVQIHQWETLVLVIDAVASSISHEDKEMIEIGLRDLEKCYTRFKQETTLELKSIILSTVSALFVFLALSKKSGTFGETHFTFMNSIFESVFQCFNYENVTYARDIRRHAAALMIKLSTKYPDMICLSFDVIHSATIAISSKLSSMEYTSLMESLLITCNCWNDPVKQSAFIGSLLSASEWSQISADSESLQKFILILQEQAFQDKRILFMKNLQLLNCIIRRVKKLNKSNGVLQQTTGNVNLMSNGVSPETEIVHPAYDNVCPLLPVILKLVKTMHSLLDDPQSAFLVELSEQEKSHIMGIHFSGGAQTAAGEPIPASVIGIDTEKPHAEKLKLFIQNIIELTYGILGGTPGLFSPKFYFIPQVADAYLSFVGWNSTKLNDFRLRGVIRTVFSPFLLNCPSAQTHNVVKPFLQKFCPFILDRLTARWTAIENANLSGEDAEEQEVLENTSLRLLSKDYVDLVYKLLETKSHNGSSQANGVEHESDATMCESSGLDGNNSRSNHTGGSGDEPGECGIIILSDPVCYQSIIHLCIQALCWDDSYVCLKASRCILLSWIKISEHADVIRATFGTVLRALCMWYENEANMDCLLKVLDLTFKNCYQADPSLCQMLVEWGANEVDIQKLIALCNGPKNDKKRKDLFRRMVTNNPGLEKNRSPKAQWLRGLPQLHLNNKSKDSKQNQPDIDLSECFSSIHHPQ